jgi:ATP-dependent exoDNAse (exonuclease V) alpha subunit
LFKLKPILLNLVGIYNGARGTVVGFAFQGYAPSITIPMHAIFHTMEPREIPTVFVKMDNPIGYTIQQGSQDIIPFVAICRQEDKYNKKYHRWQLPLEPAFACTTHKMQGATAKYGAVIDPSEKTPFSRGLDYVASSRPTELNKLTLLGPLTARQFTAFPGQQNEIRLEYDRLRHKYLL